MKISGIRHDVVIPSRPPDHIPGGAETVQASGLRLTHYGWPGIARTAAGDLLVSASERLLHICPFGREVIVRSTDNGRTWSEPEVIFDSATDDRDIALNRLADGTMVATWFSSRAWARPEALDHYPCWRPRAEHAGPDTLRALDRGWLRRSNDGGRTWEDRVYPTPVGQHAGPTPLADGGLIYCGPLRDAGGVRTVAARSNDGGRTWRIEGTVSYRVIEYPGGDREAFFNENHVLELRPGVLLAAFRCAGAGRERVIFPGDAFADKQKTVWFIRSDDGGRTWREPVDTGVFGFPPYLLRLSSGALLCVFSVRRWDLCAIRGMVSHDEGEHWDTDNVLSIREYNNDEYYGETIVKSYEFAGETYDANYKLALDMGYPGAIETAPNEVLCTYYMIPKPDPGYPGRDPYANRDPADWGILSTRFRLD